MAHQSHRREFMQTSALAGLGLWVAGGVKAQESQSPNEKIRFACIGVGGKGSSDSADAGKHGDVVAICDIDVERLEGAAKKFPNAKKFYDYRQMLDEMHDSIDAVTVSTPDHSHAPASIMAMKMGETLFYAKAPDAVVVRGAADGRSGPRDEGRHANGEPRYGRRRFAPGGEGNPGGRAGRRRRSPRLDESPCLAAGAASCRRLRSSRKT